MIIDHGHGLSSSFLHLSEILVTVGARVEQGAPIAKVGATGRATGPHLDWRMNWRNVRVDPELVLETFPLSSSASIVFSSCHAVRFDHLLFPLDHGGLGGYCVNYRVLKWTLVVDKNF